MKLTRKSAIWGNSTESHSRNSGILDESQSFFAERGPSMVSNFDEPFEDSTWRKKKGPVHQSFQLSGWTARIFQSLGGYLVQPQSNEKGAVEASAIE